MTRRSGGGGRVGGGAGGSTMGKSKSVTCKKEVVREAIMVE